MNEELLNESNFPGVKLKHTKEFIKLLKDNDGIMEISIERLNDIFKSAVYRSYCIKKLKELGILKLLKRGSKDSRRANIYTINQSIDQEQQIILPIIEEEEFLNKPIEQDQQIMLSNVKTITFKYKGFKDVVLKISTEDKDLANEVRKQLGGGLEEHRYISLCVQLGMNEIKASFFYSKLMEKIESIEKKRIDEEKAKRIESDNLFNNWK